MVKKLIQWGLSVIVVAVVALFAIQLTKHNRALAPIRMLPAIELQTMDSLSCNTQALDSLQKPLVIICFHPECGFCEMEADEMLAHYKELGDVQLLFVTYAPADEIADFLKKHPLDMLPNAKILRNPKHEFFDTFGVDAPPASFVYDRNCRLVKQQKGTVAVEQLKHYIDQCR